MGPGIKFRQYGRGFTLIELLVVISIISILATILLLQLGIARGKARDAKRIADVGQIRSALELYFDNNGGWPAQTDMTILKSEGYLINVPSDPLVGVNCGNNFSGAVVGVYNCYGYSWNPNVSPSRFQVWTELEYSSAALGSDVDIDSTGWSGAAIEGDDEVDCNNDTPQDCIYDIGYEQ